jgi:hypothetical protein
MELVILLGVIWWFATWISAIYVSHEIGIRKNRAKYAWGFWLGWLGVVAVYVLPPRPE